MDEDRYTSMSGPALAAELQDRELPVSGKVEELRDRLRADDAEKHAERLADEFESGSEGEEVVELPEPREPVEYAAGSLVLTEDQARQLTAGEARLRGFTKHVNPMSERKYAEGDQVIAVLVPAGRYAVVLPFGVEVTLTDDAEPED